MGGLKRMNKKELIIDALQALITEGKGAACPVSDIARQAGIGKGSIYYYFESKEDILDALVDRNYSSIIELCREKVEQSGLPAIPKMGLLFQTYYSFSIENHLDRYLHDPQNAYIHQKSLAKILTHLSPILADIIIQGIQESTFCCAYPQELAELILSEFCFVLDPGIFKWGAEQMKKKKSALSEFMEKALSAPKGSFDFLKT
jgi:AcrR family transcriptional regulator